MNLASTTIVETSSGTIIARDPELAAALEALLDFEAGRHSEADLDEVLRLDLDALT